jgi:hypothetical protein
MTIRDMSTLLAISLPILLLFRVTYVLQLNNLPKSVFASHGCAESVGFFLIPVHDSDGNPAGCLPAKDKKDCNENKEFKKECKDFFKNLVGGKT